VTAILGGTLPQTTGWNLLWNQSDVVEKSRPENRTAFAVDV
jgi:hypothetical protein